MVVKVLRASKVLKRVRWWWQC